MSMSGLSRAPPPRARDTHLAAAPPFCRRRRRTSSLYTRAMLTSVVVTLSRMNWGHGARLDGERRRERVAGRSSRPGAAHPQVGLDGLQVGLGVGKVGFQQLQRLRSRPRPRTRRAPFSR
eukprot:scaffold1040_cov376-Prasinococcus_capsulatus_cf.AAC.3